LWNKPLKPYKQDGVSLISLKLKIAVAELSLPKELIVLSPPFLLALGLEDVLHVLQRIEISHLDGQMPSGTCESSNTLHHRV
jgi:hypothetical protein